jgi:hypothetical protein
MTDDDVPDRQKKERLTIRLPRSLYDAVDDAVLETEQRSDLPNLSRADVIRYMIEQGEDCWSDSVETLIPDALVEEWQVTRERKRIKKRAYIDDLAGGWRGRVKSALNGRLAGEEPYHPRYIRSLADSFEEEARLYFDGQELEDRVSWLYDRVEAYIDAFEAKGAVPERLYDDVDDVSLGRDLRRLQERPVEVVELIEEVAESEAFDPDAIIDRVSSEFDVDVEAVETVLDAMTREDVDERQALKAGDGFRTFVPGQALQEPDEQDDDLDLDRVDDPPDRFDDATEPLRLTAEDVDLDPDPDPEIDPDELRDVVGGDD